jgi:tetratricopeptide (TPR) repeat protein
MSNVAKLKKQAAEFEGKKQFDKALALYVKLLDSFDEHADELDVALFNRVGDLMLRQGNVADAVDYYEKAVDRYSDTGFFNNAIALCNKILRHSPGRASVYYKLGKISAQKGFKGDAKVNFLEYADRMQKSGNVNEAFRALKEFADLSPDQDEIRLMLADQLTKADRTSEAVDQLQILYARYESEARSAEASAMADRIHSLDPSVELKSDGASFQKSSGSDLIFLDLDAPTPGSRASGMIPVQAEPPAPKPAPKPAAPPPPPRAPTPPRAIEAVSDDPLGGITRIGDDVIGIEQTPSSSLLGLESTHLADDTITKSTPTNSLLDLEPTALGFEAPPPVHRSSAPTHAAEHETPAGGDLDFILPDVDTEPAPRDTPSLEFESTALVTPPIGEPAARLTPRPTPHQPTVKVDDAALDGLPLMEIDIPEEAVPQPRQPRTTQSLSEITSADELGMIDEAVADEPLVDLNEESLTIDDDEPVIVPTPSIARRSTMVALQSVEILQASVEGEPENWSLRRELAEAMLEAGDRDGGIRELESAMAGAERSGDLDLASSLAEEVARLEPEAVKYHQKRVEYAFRTNDRGRLIEAYLALGDALHRSDQADKARTIYQRVIELAPDELRAQTALETIVVPEPEPAPAPAPRTSSAGRRTTAVPAMPEPKAAEPTPANGFVNLGDWLREDDEPKDTRMVVAEQEPTGDEDADFADMLKKFKQGVAENVDAEDYQSHYDLAIAYKEMGLLDEAIAGFQKALGSPTNRLPTYEALGQCFLEKGQPKLASSILSRGLTEKAGEDQLVGVLYLLGRAAEEQGNASDALMYYQRVFVLDIQFRDIAERMNEVERAGR